MSEPLLELSDLHVKFPVPSGAIHAVRGLDLTVHAGEVVGIVGESGSGKSVSMLSVLGLHGPAAEVSGSVTFRGRELIGAHAGELRHLCGGRIGMIFQDPMTSLNPALTVGRQLSEAVIVHQKGSKRAAAERAIDLLDMVSMPNPKGRLRSYPHELSGGMRQRVMIAMEMADDPDLRGETLSIVGESGCGKSTTARCVMQILSPTSGSVQFDGQELTELPDEDLRRLRRRFQMVFQDPQASLNPRMTVRQILSEPLEVHDADPATIRPRVDELMQLVQLRSADLDRYAHQFSGGQRQRIGIARAIALSPDMIALDEPVSALDGSIQAENIRLLESLRDELGLAYLFIAHDLSVVRHLSDRVAVMYLGKIVESGTNEDVYEHSAHPYTQALLAAAPIPDPILERQRSRIIIEGEVPSPLDPPSGCRFRTRCWKATQRCADEEPPLTDPGIGHLVACHHPEEVNVVQRSFSDHKEHS